MDESKVRDHHGFLWIKGKLGCGKSTIMKQAVDAAERDQPGTLILSYFFNARGTGRLEKSPLGLYRSLVHQMLKILPQVREKFIEQFAWKIETYSNIEWAAGELEGFLIQTLRKPSRPRLRLSLFIDALDEGDQMDVRQMVAFLEDLTQHTAESHSGNMVRVCLSSRHYPNITIKKGVLMNLEDQVGHKEDIRKYIQKKLVIEEHALAKQLEDAISHRSRQIFLWVVLVIPILNMIYDGGGTTSTLLSHLQTLPDELHGLFTEVILKDFSTTDQSAVLFQLVLFSLRPLTPEEVYVGVHIGSGKPLDLEESTEASEDRFILQCSRGLVEVENIPTLRRSETPLRTVQFIHESVRELLIQKTESLRLRPEVTGNISELSHDHLKQICVGRIKQFAALVRSCQAQEITQLLDLRYHDLLWYALNNMFEHAAIAQDCGVSQAGFIGSFDEQNDNHDLQQLWETFTEDGERLWDHSIDMRKHTNPERLKIFHRIAVAAPDWLADSYVAANQSAFLEWYVSSWLCVELRMESTNAVRPLSACVAASLARIDLSQLPHDTILREDVVALNLTGQANIDVCWTSNLSMYLTFEPHADILYVFPHNHLLEQFERSVEGELFPAGFIKEVRRTLALLFPPLGQSNVERRLAEIDIYIEDRDALKRDLASYPYFAERLMQIQQRYNAQSTKLETLRDNSSIRRQ